MGSEKDRKRTYAVFGLGNFGMEICKTLSEMGCDIIAVDEEQKLINKVKDNVAHALLLDSADEDALRNAGFQEVDVAVVAIGDNMDSNILTTIALKNIGIPYIISRAMTTLHAQVLKEIGATEVINIQIEQGRRLAARMAAPSVMDMIPISENQTLAEVRVPNEFTGKPLRELDVRKNYGVNIISVKRTKTDVDNIGNPKVEKLVFSPKPMDIFEINDILVILGEEKDIYKFKGAAE